MNIPLAKGILAFCLATASAGCAGVGGNGAPLTALDRATQNCVGAMFLTTVGGVAIGAMTGGRRAVEGGAVGLAAGGVLCAVMLAVANEEDKKRILENERLAVAEGKARSQSYAKDGVGRRIETRVYDYAASAPQPTPAAKPSAAKKTAVTTAAAPAPPEARVCRYAETTIEVTGQGTASTDKQLYCRSEPRATGRPSPTTPNAPAIAGCKSNETRIEFRG